MKKRKVTKREWYSLGGLLNPKCTRRQQRGRWAYYVG